MIQRSTKSNQPRMADMSLPLMYETTCAKVLKTIDDRLSYMIDDDEFQGQFIELITNFSRLRTQTADAQQSATIDLLEKFHLAEIRAACGSLYACLLILNVAKRGDGWKRETQLALIEFEDALALSRSIDVTHMVKAVFHMVECMSRVCALLDTRRHGSGDICLPIRNRLVVVMERTMADYRHDFFKIMSSNPKWFHAWMECMLTAHSGNVNVSIAKITSAIDEVAAFGTLPESDLRYARDTIFMFCQSLEIQKGAISYHDAVARTIEFQTQHPIDSNTPLERDYRERVIDIHFLHTVSIGTMIVNS